MQNANEQLPTVTVKDLNKMNLEKWLKLRTIAAAYGRKHDAAK